MLLRFQEDQKVGLMCEAFSQNDEVKWKADTVNEDNKKPQSTGTRIDTFQIQNPGGVPR